MLLQHAWLAPLDKPATIEEEDEEAAEAAEANGEPAPEAKLEPVADQGGFYDREVGEWAIQALEKKRNGTLGQSAKPALHAAPLDATTSR
jgi:mitogen-activated protein kinase kinase